MKQKRTIYYVFIPIFVVVTLLFVASIWPGYPQDPFLPEEALLASLESGLEYFQFSPETIDPIDLSSAFTGGAVAGDAITFPPEKFNRFLYRYYYVYEGNGWERKLFSGASSTTSNWIIGPKNIIVKGQLQPGKRIYIAFYSCSSRHCREGWKVHELSVTSSVTGARIETDAVVKGSAATIPAPAQKDSLAPRSTIPNAPRPSRGLSGGGGSSSDGGGGGGNQNSQCDEDSDCSLFYSCRNNLCVRLYGESNPPQVFNTNFYQSPVQAEPGDLLLIPGYNFSSTGVVVVYKNVSDNPGTLAVPDSIPASNTSTQGRLHVGLVTNDSVTVLLPPQMLANKTYALWVKNNDSSWSEQILINNPRPLWITPPRAYSTQLYARLPRQIKVVGRNMADAGEGKPRVIRLDSANASYNLTVIPFDSDPNTRIDHYVAKANLPASLSSGLYNISYSRDNETWISLPHEANFTILGDQTKTRYAVSDYGGCLPNDGNNDVGCIINAIRNASVNGGGEVFFSNGTWNLTPDPSQLTTTYGIIVNKSVDLVGSGFTNTTLLHSKSWDVGISSANVSIFTLQGNNIISNLNFATQDYNQTPASVPAYLYFGKQPGQNTTADPFEIDNVTIHDCNFTDFYQGMSTFGFPVKNLFVVNNYFDQLYDDAIDLSGDRNQRNIHFRVEDAVIINNTFIPGDSVDAAAGTGTIATQLSGAKRMDFSDNLANGTLNGGWRAAHFWASLGSNERLLIANNRASCTGDKAGDGEAIVIDHNQNTGGFPTTENVTSATSNTVTTTGTPMIWNVDYYLTHNLYIADGKGLGQVRKIANYTNETNPSFVVSPAWDVIPDTTSKVMIHRVHWQAYFLDNLVDIRTESGCAKSSPRSPQQEGQVSFQSATSDSVMDGNDLYDTNGIYFPTNIRTNDSNVHYFDEIKYNLVQREYFHPTSTGGINLVFQSSFTNPVSGYGNVISHNTVNGSDTLNSVTQSDATPRAAVALVPQGASSATPYEWKNTLIFQNLFDNTSRGIYVVRNYSWYTTLYNNTILNIKKHRYLTDFGTNTSYCGNYKLELFEACDAGIFQNCSYGATSCQVCSDKCTGLVTGNATYCGDNACDLKVESSSSCPQDCLSNCPANGLLAWWRGENNFYDQVNQRDAEFNSSFNDSSASNFGTGQVGNAFSLDGVDDFIYSDAATSHNFTGAGLTFMAWVNPNDLNTTDDYTILGVANGNSLSTNWFIDGASNKTEFQLGGSTDGVNAFRQILYPVPAGKWNHLVVTWNATDGFRGYMNGTQVDTVGTNINSIQWGQASTAGFAMGVTRTQSPLSRYNGSLDEVAIWNRVLNSSEVQAIYDAGTQGMCNQSFY